MITIDHSDSTVSVAVLGEFTIADFKTFEEQTLYKLKSPGELNLLFDLRVFDEEAEARDWLSEKT